MTLANEDGHSNQTDRSDDVLNALEDADRSMTISDIFHVTSIDVPDIKRALEDLEADGDVIIDRDFAANWRARLA